MIFFPARPLFSIPRGFGQNIRAAAVATFGVLALAGATIASAADTPLRIALFNVDATPPLGAPLCDGLCPPAASVDDPLSARGIVILSHEAPIVLCAVDWCGIGNRGHDAWRNALAQAAGTTPDRVAVHTLHQHDAPGCDFDAEDLLAEYGLAGQGFHVQFAKMAIERTAQAVQQALKAPKNVTHLGIGVAKVERVASNRRVLGPDGKVKFVRYSSCRDPEAIAAPEGTIDPNVPAIVFWDGYKPLAILTYYATHPQSYYAKGAVSGDFVGLARAKREQELPGVAHIHFCGAGGNVAAGKYNDGSPERRPELRDRLAAGMRAAWENAKKKPVSAADVHWRTTPVSLPLAPHLDEAKLSAKLGNSAERMGERVRASRDLAWIGRVRAGKQIELACLQIGDAYILHMPGELFVEYQLAAQKMKPDATVCMAAYGDYSPGYIGLEAAYSQGGYETGFVSRTAPAVEHVLMAGMKKLLDPQTP